MTTPAVPRAAFSAHGLIDEDAALSVDQVSEDPPAAGEPPRHGASIDDGPLPGKRSLASDEPAAASDDAGDASDAGDAGGLSAKGGLVPTPLSPSSIDDDEVDGPQRCDTERRGLVITGRVPEAIDPALSPQPRPGGAARVVLDPSQALDIPHRPPRRRKKRPLSPAMIAVFGGVFGLAAIASVLALLIQIDGPTKKFGAAPASSGGKGGKGPSALVGEKAFAPAMAAAVPASSASAEREPEPEAPRDPGPFRVSQLSGDESVRVVQGKLGTRSLTDALEEDKVPKAQIARILKSFGDSKVFDRPKKSHSYLVAIERGSKRVKAFEYVAGATEVWQAKENEEGLLVGEKLDLHVEQRRVARAVVVKDDLKSAVVEAGFDEHILDALDEALDDRLQRSRFGKGTTLRIVAQEQTVSGKFSRYVDLEALEYRLKGADKPIRLYHFKAGKAAGYFDDRGKAPFRGGWRAPLKFPRVTSRFNPKRLHPVLHTVMPHNGTDFGAPMGTPVYAVSSGTVTWVGPHGPSGNLVLIMHDGNLETGYAHLSKFAPGIKKGDKVETRQLVGFVGSTGRSTGPHLHFSTKKNGAFVDPLTVLKMDGERVVPKGEREAFDSLRSELDKIIEGINLPDRGSEPDTPEPPENDDEDHHGDEPEGSAEGAAVARKGDKGDKGDKGSDRGDRGEKGDKGDDEPVAPTRQPVAPSKTDDSVDSAVWKP